MEADNATYSCACSASSSVRQRGKAQAKHCCHLFSHRGSLPWPRCCHAPGNFRPFAVPHLRSQSGLGTVLYNGLPDQLLGYVHVRNEKHAYFNTADDLPVLDRRWWTSCGIQLA